MSNFREWLDEDEYLKEDDDLIKEIFDHLCNDFQKKYSLWTVSDADAEERGKSRYLLRIISCTNKTALIFLRS